MFGDITILDTVLHEENNKNFIRIYIVISSI